MVIDLTSFSSWDNSRWKEGNLCVANIGTKREPNVLLSNGFASEIDAGHFGLSPSLFVRVRNTIPPFLHHMWDNKHVWRVDESPSMLFDAKNRKPWGNQKRQQEKTRVVTFRLNEKDICLWQLRSAFEFLIHCVFFFSFPFRVPQKRQACSKTWWTRCFNLQR